MTEFFFFFYLLLKMSKKDESVISEGVYLLMFRTIVLPYRILVDQQ